MINVTYLADGFWPKAALDRWDSAEVSRLYVYLGILYGAILDNNKRYIR